MQCDISRLKKKLLDEAAVWLQSFGPLMDTVLTALLFGVCLASGLETARWLHDDLLIHQGWMLSVFIPIVISILVFFFLFRFGVFLYVMIARFINKDETDSKITKD